MHGSIARRLLISLFLVLPPLAIFFTASAALPPCADLVTTAFSITPTTPTAGQLATIHVEVTNQGTCSTDVGFVVQWKQTQYAKTGPSASYGPLGPGASQSQDFDYTFPKGGNFLTVVKIDTDRSVRETNEVNNIDIESVSVSPATIDLVINSFTISPNPVGQGLDATATIQVQNTGNTDAGPFQVAWKPTTNTSPITQNVPGLAAGTATNVVLHFNYPDLGTFLSVATVDATHLISETSEFNNTAYTSETIIPALPDLQITGVTFNPATPIQGQSVHVTVSVFNGGNTSTNDPFAVQFRQKKFGVPLSTQIAALAPGASENAEFDTVFPSEGTFNTVATVDSNNVIYELDENNNTFTQPIDVTPANIDLTITNIVINPATPQQGVAMTATVTVANNGNNDAGPFTVSWNPDANGLLVPSPGTLTQQVNSLASGATTDVVFNFNYPQFGSFHTIATVDAFSVIKETNETNNEAIKDFDVSPGDVNLQIESFTVNPGSNVLKRFEKATATIVVKNVGTFPAGPFKVEWKLIDTNTSGPSTTVQGLAAAGDPLGRDKATVTLTGTYFEPGTYTLVAIVDSTDKVIETNEGDNTMTITGFVVKPTT